MEACEKEGLCLTEFNDAVFQNKTKETPELEYIADEIIEKIKRKSYYNKQNSWHCILEGILEVVVPNGIREALEHSKDRFIEAKYAELYRLIIGFYSNSLLLQIDVAQELQYNLLRLGKTEVVNWETENKEVIREYEKWISIGRKKYGGNVEKTTGKEDEIIDENTKDIYSELFDDLSRLQKKYEGKAKPQVHFHSNSIEKEKIFIEEDWRELNLTFIGNEEFQDYLYHVGYQGKYYKTLTALIMQLNELDLPMQYMWEKMTNFNVICILGKFFWNISGSGLDKEITKKKQKMFLEQMIESEKYLFREIRNMPNYLTRLLLLKQVFAYIEKCLFKEDLLEQVKNFFMKFNGPYRQIRGIVLTLAPLIKWKIEEKETLNRIKWMDSLKAEYPDSLFEELYLSSDCRAVEKINIPPSSGEKWNVRDTMILNELQSKVLLMERDHLYENGGWLLEYKRKKKYLDLVSQKNYRYANNSRDFSEMLIRNEYIPFEELLSEDEELQEGFIETPFGKLFVEYEIDDLKKGEKKTDKNKMEEKIEKIIKYNLLSEYNNVIYENTEKIKYEEYINNILYHFYD